MDFDIKKFSTLIELEGKRTIQEAYEKNYILMVLLNDLSIDQIDFSVFDNSDIADVMEDLEEAITDEDENGELSLDPSHPYTRIWSLGVKMKELEDMPRLHKAPTNLFI